MSASMQVHEGGLEFSDGENDFAVTFAIETRSRQPGCFQLMCNVRGLHPREWNGVYMMGINESLSL